MCYTDFQEYERNVTAVKKKPDRFDLNLETESEFNKTCQVLL